MPREEFIRGLFKKGTNQKIIGILRYEDNGDITAMAYPSRKIVGKYIVLLDHTIEFPSRKVVTKGNTVVQLLYIK